MANTPPKPKELGKVGRPIVPRNEKGRYHLSMAEKAKRAARRKAKALEEQEKKAAAKKAQITAKKNKVKEVAKAVDGKKTTIVTDDALKQVPETTQEYLGRNVIFKPNPGPQTDFLAADEKEVFYGGARGGGKSYALLIDPLRYCNNPNHQALILRRTMPELRDLIFHSQKLYDKAYPGAKWKEQEKLWKFPSGAVIEFGYAETRQDVLRYQGRAYTWIGVDELPQYDGPWIIQDLRGSLRSVDPTIPTYFRASGNPGNIGSGWVKEMFIDPAPPNTTFTIEIPSPAGVKRITRKYIPAKVTDNPHLMQTDDYVTMLASLTEMKRRQWLEGDWDAFDNQAFPEFRREVHVVEPFEIPRNWPRFRAADWGYSSPGCVLWFAVDNEGVLYAYKEYYGKGLTADIFAQKILTMEQGERIQYGVLDSSVWARRGDTGPSIPETMANHGCRWRPADRSPGSREATKLELHRRLAIDPILEKPRLQIFSNCVNLVRTLPMLPVAENNPEDVNTKAEDHAYDALRYGCASRPLLPSQYDSEFGIGIKEKVFTPADNTFGY